MKKIGILFATVVIMLMLVVSASATSTTDEPLGRPFVTIHDYKRSTVFTWKPVIGADFYRIYKSDGSSWIYITDTKGTEYNVNLTKDKAYDYYAIRAGRYENGKRALAPVFTSFNILKTKQSLFEPVVTVTRNTDSISLSWDSQKNAEGYLIMQYISGAWKRIGKTTARKYTLKNLESGQKLTLAVKAYRTDSGTTMVLKKFTPIYTATKTSLPTNITSKQNTNAIKLTWDGCKGASGYKIYYLTNGRWEAICKVSGTTALIKNLPAGKEYTYAIRPYITNEKTVLWNDYSTCIASTTPEAPVLTAESSAMGEISVKWTGVSAEGYALYYKRGNGNYKLYKKYNTTQKLKFSGLNPGVVYTFAVRAYNKIPSGYILSKYTPVSVKVSATSSSSSSTDNRTLTNASATALWKEANRAYIWDFYDYLDVYDSVIINGGTWYRTTHPFIKSVADEREYLSQYFSDEIIENKLTRFKDYNGGLYVSYISGMGMPPTFNSVTVKSQSGNYAQINVTMTDPGGNKSTRVQKMQYIDGNWKFVDSFIYIHGDV